jgi:hypothetical protein
MKKLLILSLSLLPLPLVCAEQSPLTTVATATMKITRKQKRKEKQQVFQEAHQNLPAHSCSNQQCLATYTGVITPRKTNICDVCGSSLRRIVLAKGMSREPIVYLTPTQLEHLKENKLSSRIIYLNNKLALNTRQFKTAEQQQQAAVNRYTTQIKKFAAEGERLGSTIKELETELAQLKSAKKPTSAATASWITSLLWSSSTAAAPAKPTSTDEKK